MRLVCSQPNAQSGAARGMRCKMDHNTDACRHTFCAESLSSSTTVYNRNGGLKSYVLLHDKCLSGAGHSRACCPALGTST